MTQTLTLTEFLLARIAEDEAVANVCTAWDDTRSALHEGGRYVEASPSRVLAECEAKRRIVKRSSYADDTKPTYNAMAFEPGDGIATDNLHDLALIYADHPDYREEWRA